MVNQFKSGIDQIKQGASDISNGGTPVQGLEAGLNIESGIASLATSPLAPLFRPVGAAINYTADKIGSIPAVQKFADSSAGQTTARVAGDLANAGNIAGTILGADQVVKVAPQLPSMASNVVSTIGDKMSAITNKIFPASEGKINSAIVTSYNKAVRPTIAGKGTPQMLDAYNKNVSSGIRSIANNKDALSFETDSGTEVGRFPQTRAELADSVAQTKQAIFSQYDALAKQTGEKGVQIPLEPAGGALEDVVKNEALKITNPEAIKYAQNLQERFQNPDGTYKAVTPEITQQVITNYNSSLKAFYRNPTYDSASRAAIDAGVVNELRKALDEAINNATGKDYQGLKNQYGALSAIEKDVAKAAIAQAKQTGTNTAGLGKYVDVFSGGDMVSGLLSLNPALFAKGVAQSGISHFFQWLNSPDRAVGTMFDAAAKGVSPSNVRLK